jgi:hypothetical protein
MQIKIKSYRKYKEKPGIEFGSKDDLISLVRVICISSIFMYLLFLVFLVSTGKLTHYYYSLQSFYFLRNVKDRMDFMNAVADTNNGDFVKSTVILIIILILILITKSILYYKIHIFIFDIFNKMIDKVKSKLMRNNEEGERNSEKLMISTFNYNSITEPDYSLLIKYLNDLNTSTIASISRFNTIVTTPAKSGTKIWLGVKNLRYHKRLFFPDSIPLNNQQQKKGKEKSLSGSCGFILEKEE